MGAGFLDQAGLLGPTPRPFLKEWEPVGFLEGVFCLSHGSGDTVLWPPPIRPEGRAY